MTVWPSALWSWPCLPSSPPCQCTTTVVFSSSLGLRVRKRPPLSPESSHSTQGLKLRWLLLSLSLVKCSGKGPPGVMAGQLCSPLDMLWKWPSGCTNTSYFFLVLDSTNLGQKESLLNILCTIVSFSGPGHIDLSRVGPLGKLDQRGPTEGFWNFWTWEGCASVWEGSLVVENWSPKAQLWWCREFTNAWLRMERKPVCVDRKTKQDGRPTGCVQP